MITDCLTYLDRVYTQGCTEDLRAEIETITVTLLRKKQDLYRQHGLLIAIVMAHYKIKKKEKWCPWQFFRLLFHFADSNQTRHSKRRKLRDLKKKLRDKVLQYNASEEDEIDEDLACNLTEGYILPWERSEDGMMFSLLTKT